MICDIHNNQEGRRRVRKTVTRRAFASAVSSMLFHLTHVTLQRRGVWRFRAAGADDARDTIPFAFDRDYATSYAVLEGISARPVASCRGIPLGARDAESRGIDNRVGRVWHCPLIAHLSTARYIRHVPISQDLSDTFTRSMG